MNITVREIVQKFLEDNNYDGLGCDYCSCEVSDLMPCDDEQFSYACWAGYKVPCPGEEVCEHGGCDFHIAIKKGGDDVS